MPQPPPTFIVEVAFKAQPQDAEEASLLGTGFTTNDATSLGSTTTAGTVRPHPVDPALPGVTASGQPWQPLRGVWGRDGLGAALNTGQGTENVAVIETLSRGRLSMGLGNVTNLAGLAFRVKDARSYFQARVGTGTPGTLNVWRYDASKSPAHTQVASVTLSRAWVSTDRIEALLTATGFTVEARASDGTLLATTGAVADTFNLNERKAGFYVNSTSASARFASLVSGLEWTNLNAVAGSKGQGRVVELRWKRGRQRELGRQEAGTATVVLDNRDRRYDPEHTGSPFWPNVKVRRRIRIRAVWTPPGGSPTNYPQFDGEIERWPQRYLGHNNAVVPLQATDGFKALARGNLPTSPWEAEVRQRRPAHWYLRADEEFTRPAFDSVEEGRLDGTWMVGSGSTRRPTYKVESPIVRDEDTSFGVEFGADPFEEGTATGVCLDYAQVADASGVGPLGTLAGEPWALGVWLRLLPYFAVSQHKPVQAFWPNGQLGLEFVMNYDGLGGGGAGANDQLYVFTYTQAGAYVAGSTHNQQVLWARHNGPVVEINGTTVTAGVSAGWVHAMAVYDGIDVRLYVNGQPASGFPEVSSTLALPTGPLRLGRFGATDYTADQVSMSEVTFFRGAPLGAADVLALYRAGIVAWRGDRSDERLGKVLDTVRWSRARRRLSVGRSTLGSTSMSGAPLDYVQRVAESESGSAYIDRAGNVRFRERHEILKPPMNQSQATFGDAPGEVNYRQVDLDYSDGEIINTVRARREEGPTVEVRDEASRAEYDEQAYERTLMIQSDQEVYDFGKWVTAHYAQPQSIVEQIGMPPLNDDEATRLALTLELEQRVTVRRRPPGGGTIEKAVHIQGIEQHVEPTRRWEWTAWLSPADTQPYLILDHASLGQLDNNRLAY